MTLKQALSTQGLCGTPSSVNSYSNKPATIQFHYATQVEVTTSTGTKSLQDAINSGEILYTKNYNSLCSSNNLYYQDSCNRLGNLKTDCSVGVDTTPIYTGLTCVGIRTPNAILPIGGSGFRIDKTGTYNSGTCSNNACSIALRSTETKLVDCFSGYTCADGDTSGDCFTGWTAQSGTFTGLPNDGTSCLIPLPADTCDGNKNNPSSCPATGPNGVKAWTCTDSDYTGCTVDSLGYTYTITWNTRTLQCNSL